MASPAPRFRVVLGLGLRVEGLCLFLSFEKLLACILCFDACCLSFVCFCCFVVLVFLCLGFWAFRVCIDLGRSGF